MSESDHNPLTTIPMEMGLQTVPEAILEEILARLPLRNIARFKSVCKTWKSLIESPCFRRLFLSLHQDSSSSWSLMFRNVHSNYPLTEVTGYHRCETWDLPKSLASYIFDFQRNLNIPESHCYYVASSNGLIWIDISFITIGNMPPYTLYRKSFVSNPVLRQWVEIPPPPEPCEVTSLVTRVEEDGVVSSFKVVRTCKNNEYSEVCEWRVYVYSSITGKWIFKRLVSSHPVDFATFDFHVNINGMLYLWEKRFDSSEPGPGVLVAYDFYADEEANDDQCRVIPLPLPVPNDEHVFNCLTTSGGYVVLIQVLDRRLKLWRLNNNDNNSDDTSEWWHLLREEINMESAGFGVDCFPMAMNPFDDDILYLWWFRHYDYCLVTGNLGTKELVFHREPESCVANTCDYSLKICKLMEARFDWIVSLSQFVLPRWMDSVPRPPNLTFC